MENHSFCRSQKGIRKSVVPARCTRAGTISLGSLLLLLPQIASAHGTVEGLDEFVNGLLHPLFSPAHVLVLLAFGFWIGTHPPIRLRSPLPAFALGALAGLLCAWKGMLSPVYQPVLLGVAMLAAIVVAADFKLPLSVRVTCGVIAGFLLGLDSPPDLAGNSQAIFKTLIGTWIGLYIWLVNPAFYTSLLPQKKWASYAVRIAASWIIAIAVMVLAFAFRK